MKKINIISIVILGIILIGSICIYAMNQEKEVKFILKLHAEIFDNKTFSEALDMKIGDYIEFVDEIKFKSNFQCHGKGCENLKCFPNHESEDGTVKCGKGELYFIYQKNSDSLVSIVEKECELLESEKIYFAFIIPIQTDRYLCEGYDGNYGVAIQ